MEGMREDEVKCDGEDAGGGGQDRVRRLRENGGG